MTKGIGVIVATAMVMALQAQSAQVIREVVVRGNERVTTEAIRAAMRSSEGRPFLEAELQRDQQSLLQLGVFKDVKIQSRPLSETDVQVTVDVSENPVVKEISVIGNSVIKTEEILRVVTQRTGQLLNFNARRPTAEAIRQLYDSRGFFAEVDFPTDQNAPESMVILVIETKVNDVVITGVRRTRARVIDRLIRTQPGDPLNERTWASDVRRVGSTQWFEAVEPGIRPTEDIGRVDLLLNLKETSTARFDLGVALDPRSRLAGTFRVTDTNWQGRGQTLGLNYQQDTFGSGASASMDFLDPFFDKRDTTMSIQLYSRVASYFTSLGSGGSAISNEDRFDERRSGGALSFTRRVRTVDATLGVSFDNIRAVNLGAGSADFIRQDGSLMKVLIQAARDRRDVPLDPFEGDFVRLSVEPGFSRIDRIGGSVASFTDILGSNGFVRTTVEYKGFFSRRPRDRRRLSDPRPVLATRARFGTITGVVPFYEQLFIGGSDSLRGYHDQRFWGKTAALASVEYRMPVPGASSFNVIGFADYGGAWGGYPGIGRFDQSTDFRMQLGYGVGFGFRTPLGPIRIDFGFTPEGRQRTHFSIGGTF